MRLHLDEKVDALYIRFDDSAIVDSEEITPGIVLDFNAQHDVVGIEVLRVQARFPSADLRHVSVDVA